MAIDRNKAFEISNDGILFEGGSHLSSGINTPTHVGLKGDWFFKTIDSTLWRLNIDGSTWVQLSELFNIDGGFANSVYLPTQIIDGMGA